MFSEPTWMKLANSAMYPLAGLFFMVVIFAGAAYGNNHTLSQLEERLLNASVYVLPLIPILAALVVPHLYTAGWQAWLCYGLYFLPLIFMMVFIVYVS